jgi:SAM-dependent methyltransferase
MFFSDPAGAFANLLRWLAPGGRFAFAVWGRPAENPWFMTVRETVAETIEMPPLDLDAAGAFRYSETGKLVNLLDQAGFSDLHVNDWCGMLAIGGGLPPLEAANFALGAFSTFADLLAKAGDTAINDARQSLTMRFSQHRRNNVVAMDASAHIVTGTRVV